MQIMVHRRRLYYDIFYRAMSVQNNIWCQHDNHCTISLIIILHYSMMSLSAIGRITDIRKCKMLSIMRNACQMFKEFIGCWEIKTIFMRTNNKGIQKGIFLKAIMSLYWQKKTASYRQLSTKNIGSGSIWRPFEVSFS